MNHIFFYIMHVCIPSLTTQHQDALCEGGEGAEAVGGFVSCSEFSRIYLNIRGTFWTNKFGPTDCSRRAPHHSSVNLKDLLLTSWCHVSVALLDTMTQAAVT